MSDYDPNPPPAAPVQGWSSQHVPAPQYGTQPPAAPSAGVQTTMHEMTEQLQTVIDAAERAADAIRHDAEDQARQHLVAAQRKADQLTAERVSLISDLTDDLIRHAETVKQHSEQMVRALEEAITSVTTKLDQPGFREPLAASSPSYGDAGAVAYPPVSPSAPPSEPAYEPPPPPSPPSPAGDQPYGAPAYEPPAYEPPPYQPTPPYQPPPAQPPPAQPPQAAPPAPTEQPAPMPPPPPPPEESGDEGGSGNVFRPQGY